VVQLLSEVARVICKNRKEIQRLTFPSHHLPNDRKTQLIRSNSDLYQLMVAVPSTIMDPTIISHRTNQLSLYKRAWNSERIAKACQHTRDIERG